MWCENDTVGHTVSLPALERGTALLSGTARELNLFYHRVFSHLAVPLERY
jgi:hypothetical protein